MNDKTVNEKPTLDVSIVIFAFCGNDLASRTCESIKGLEHSFSSLEVVGPSTLSLKGLENSQLHVSGDDYFEIFHLLSSVVSAASGKHVVVVPAGYLLADSFVELLLESISSHAVSVFEVNQSDNWWLSTRNKECFAEFLAEPIALPILAFKTSQSEKINGTLHFLALWDYAIGLLCDPAHSFFHRTNPVGLGCDVEYPNIPLEGYYLHLGKIEPIARLRLPLVHDEWVQLLTCTFEQIVSSRRVIFSRQLSTIIPKMHSSLTSQRLEYGRVLSEGSFPNSVSNQSTSAVSPTKKRLSQGWHLSPKLLLQSSDYGSMILDKKMKLLFLTRHCPFEEITGPIAAGAELSMRRIAEQMAALGHEVHYISFPDLRSGEFAVNGVRLHLLSYQDAQGLDFSTVEGAFSLSRKVAEGITFQNAYVKKAFGMSEKILGMRMHNRWRYRKFIESVCKKHDIDLIHCFSSAPDSVACAIVSNKLNIPMVLRMGGRFWYLKYQSLECPHRRQKYLEEINYAFQVTDCLAFNSRFIRDESFRLFEELGISYNSAETVIDIGVCPIVSTSQSTLEKLLKKSDDELIISCVGKFKKFSKRQDILVEAFACLPNLSKLTLVFAGDGPEMDDVNAIARELGVEQRVIFLGSVSQPDVYKLLEISDIFVHPTEFEGSSKAIAEAMLVGPSVLASNIPPNAEHISHDINGLLAENTVESFRQQLLRLTTDPELRSKLSSSALTYAERHFMPEVNALNYQALFYQLRHSGKLSSVNTKRRFAA